MKWVVAFALCLLVAMPLFAPPDGPALVGEGVISTQDDESGFTLSPEGDLAFFGKSSPVTTGDAMQVICLTHRDSGGKWSTPEIASFSGKFHDIGPAFQPDGRRLYFLSDRPNGEDKRNFNIWYVERDGAGWSEARALPAPAQEYGVSVSADGTLYFASNRPGGSGSFDIYRARREDGEYKAVENLGERINSKGPEIQPGISPDGKILVFAALGRNDEKIGIHREYAHGDLYVSFLKDGEWSQARNCGDVVNSGAEDAWPSFSSDGARFFFSSERGFATYRMPHAMRWEEIRRGLTSTLNGMGNIFELPTTVFKRPD
jgi:hypothetical protein